MKVRRVTSSKSSPFTLLPRPKKKNVTNENLRLSRRVKTSERVLRVTRKNVLLELLLIFNTKKRTQTPKVHEM